MEQNLNPDLNPEQLAAVRHSGGPLLIVAGAGSGKTKTLTSRIAHLISSGVEPRRILAITFTNKAAEEMLKRVESKMLSVKGGEAATIAMPFIGTFHSWGARVLKKEAGKLGRTPNFSIFDDDDALKILKSVVKGMDLDKDQFSPASFRSKISRIKNELLGADEMERAGGKPELTAKVYEGYERALTLNNAFDFDDLIEKVVRVFEKYPETQKQYQSAYDHVLVDEYQDTNTAQYRLIKLLTAKHGNLSVVGDDAQAIYGFRYSDFRNFLNFDRDFSGVKVIKLEENYRSTGNIIAGAGAVISHNQFQKPKKLWTKRENGEQIFVRGFDLPDDEAWFVVGEIQRLFNDSTSDPLIAILYRTNAQSRPIEQALMTEGIPYRIYGGVKFYDRMEIKDLAAGLQYANNPAHTVAAERLRKNFSKKEAEILLRELPEQGAKSEIVAILDFFIKTTRYIEYLEKNFKNALERIENVKEFIVFAGMYNHLGLGAFLEQISLVSSLDMPNGRRPEVGIRNSNRGGFINLMTIHAAKGLEFNQVFVAGCSEGLMPHERSMFRDEKLEEERRLMYVAMTRAKEKLFLTYSGAASRFLYEIPEELTDYKVSSRGPRKRLGSFEDEDYITYD